jgi:hypothetical protein
MLHSDTRRLGFKLDRRRRSRHDSLVADLMKAVPPPARAGALLFAGGSSFRDRIVRGAQAHLRYDRRPSLWSHVALILDWSGKAETALGAEVSLVPAAGEEAVPERNGVTVFELGRYLDAGRWPNLAIALLDPVSAAAVAAGTRDGGDDEARRRQTVRDLALAVATPNRGRPRYRFFDALAPWLAHTTAPEAWPNPLLQGVSLPSAAFCEYAYASIGIELTPGTTDAAAAPEILWASVLYYYDRIRPRLGKVRLFAAAGDTGNAAGDAGPGDLRDRFAAALGPD